MSRKRRVASGVASDICWPAVALCAPVLAELSFASRRYWFTDAAVAGHWRVLRGLAVACAAGAALLAASRRARESAARNLDAPVARGWLALSFAGVFAWLFFIKYCQYRGFQLPRDTTASANLCFNLLHGYGWRCPVYGVDNHFAVHFIPFFALMSPLLLLHNGALTLIVAQTLLLATLPFAGYLLARRLTGSGAAGWSALLLIVTSPYFFDMAIASVYPGMYLSAFFLWAAVALELDRPWLAAASILLLLSTVEQACLAALGLAVYQALRRARSDRRAAWLWAGAGALAAALFALELRYKYSFSDAARFRTWSTFHGLGPTPGAAARAALARPFAAAVSLLRPAARTAPALKLLLSTGFLPLFSPLALVPWAVDFLPNFLADPGDIYHTIGLQYAGYVIGPLWWAAVLGLCRLRARLAARAAEPALAAFALAVGGLNLYLSPLGLAPDWSRNFFSEAPGAVAAIPPRASVWALEYVSPRLACRRDVKAISDGLDPAFLERLFVPDYVLLDRGWAGRASPADRDRLLTFLGREGYAKVYERSQLVVFRHPKEPLADARGAPPPLALPGPGPEAQAAARLLARNDDASGTLALALAMARSGDDYAQFNAGLYLIQGIGAPKDEDAGLRWWKAAAERGLARAQAEYGRALFGRSDYEGAAKWLGAAAEQGDPVGERYYGILLTLGRGVPADRERAVFWLRKAADAGDAEAAKALAALK